VLRDEKKNEAPSIYIMKRWEKRRKRFVLYDFFYGCFVQ